MCFWSEGVRLVAVVFFGLGLWGNRGRWLSRRLITRHLGRHCELRFAEVATTPQTTDYSTFVVEVPTNTNLHGY